MDLISVIVPVYNVEKYLDRCVLSIQTQSYSNLEIILVDDGSPDRCGELCDLYALADRRVKVVHKMNGGLGNARNSGIECATGKYITFIDSDDWIGQRHIEDLYKAIVQHDADICFCGCTRAYSPGEEVIDRNNYRNCFYQGKEIIDNILLPMVGSEMSEHEDVQFQSSVCMALYSLDLIKNERITFLSEKDLVAEDVFFNISTLSKAKKIVCIPIVSYYYFVNQSSISQKYDPRRLVRTKKYLAQMYKTLGTVFVSETEYENRVKRSFLVKIRVLIKQILGTDFSLKEKYRYINEVINDNDVQRILSDFPLEKCPADVWLVLTLIKNKRVVLLMSTLGLKEALDSYPKLRVMIRRLRGLQ